MTYPIVRHVKEFMTPKMVSVFVHSMTSVRKMNGVIKIINVKTGIIAKIMLANANLKTVEKVKKYAR